MIDDLRHFKSQRRADDDTLVFWIVVALFLACMCLPGCATFSEDLALMEIEAKAHRTPTPDYMQLVLEVDDADAMCKFMGARTHRGGVISGCADPYGAIAPDACTIIIDKKAPPWTLHHERLHCKYGSWHR